MSIMLIIEIIMNKNRYEFLYYYVTVALLNWCLKQVMN